MTNLPAFFFGHGSPMNAIEKNSFTDHLIELAGILPKPLAVMVISAHWQTKSTMITTNTFPKQIYDFYGFPEVLYKVKYEAPIYKDIMKISAYFSDDIKISGSEEWGIDHGAWTLLKYLYPECDVPVFQLSISYEMSTKYRFELGVKLRDLRKNGILVIGSGNIVHNLRMIDFKNTDSKPYNWAVEFDDRIKTAILSGDIDTVINYHKLGEIAEHSVPTSEHYLPLLYILGIKEKDENLSLLFEGFQNKSISMTSLKTG